MNNHTYHMYPYKNGKINYKNYHQKKKKNILTAFIKFMKQLYIYIYFFYSLNIVSKPIRHTF